jgi:hypothetical protein
MYYELLAVFVITFPSFNQELVIPASDPLLLEVVSDDILFGVVIAIHRCMCVFLPRNVGAIHIDVAMYWLPMALPYISIHTSIMPVLKAGGHCTETKRNELNFRLLALNGTSASEHCQYRFDDFHM